MAAAVVLPLGALTLPRLRGSEPRELGPVDEDLQLVRRSVPDHDNGFFAIADGRAVYWPDDAHRSGEALRLSSGHGSNWELAEQILANNSDSLRRLDESLSRRDFQFPEFDDPVSWINVTTRWREIVNVLSVSAFLHAEQRATDAGLREAMKILRFAQRVQEAEGSLIQWLIGSHFKRQGLICIRELSMRADVRARQLVALSRELERYAADREAFVHTVKFEFGYALDQFEMIAHGELDPDDLLLGHDTGPGEAFDLFSTRQRMADVMRTAIACARSEPEWGIQLAPRDYAGCVDSEDRVSIQAAEGWHLGLQQGAMEDTALAATRALLALRAFEQDNGRMARSLFELVPVYLSEPPIDPFDGEPLRYSPTAEIVYSVGADLRDDGGSTKENPALARQDRSEPTFRY